MAKARGGLSSAGLLATGLLATGLLATGLLATGLLVMGLRTKLKEAASGCDITGQPSLASFRLLYVRARSPALQRYCNSEPSWHTRTPRPCIEAAKARVASSLERIGAPRGLSEVLIRIGQPVAWPIWRSRACRKGSSSEATV